MTVLDDFTLWAEGLLALLALSGTVSAWRSGRPASVFCAVVVLGMTFGALTFGLSDLALSRRPEGVLSAPYPGRAAGMGTFFALVLGLPLGFAAAGPITLARWALNRAGHGPHGDAPGT